MGPRKCMLCINIGVTVCTFSKITNQDKTWLLVFHKTIKHMSCYKHMQYITHIPVPYFDGEMAIFTQYIKNIPIMEDNISKLSNHKLYMWHEKFSWENTYKMQ